MPKHFRNVLEFNLNEFDGNFQVQFNRDVILLLQPYFHSPWVYQHMKVRR